MTTSECGVLYVFFVCLFSFFSLFAPHMSRDLLLCIPIASRWLCWTFFCILSLGTCIKDAGDTFFNMKGATQH